MALLGIDYGAKKIGLAKADDQTRMALPLEVLPNTGRDEVGERIAKMCQEYDISKIIVGAPVSLSSDTETNIREVDLQNKQMQDVLEFVEWLKTIVDLPVEVEDERMSTQMAGRLQRGSGQKGQDDDVAAMLILQNYLDKLQ